MIIDVIINKLKLNKVYAKQLKQYIANNGGGVEITTYDKVKALRNSGKLIAGKQYAITDYRTVCHLPYDINYKYQTIIVTALANNILSEDCKIITAISEYSNYVTTIYDGKYTLDKDERFGWVIDIDNLPENTICVIGDINTNTTNYTSYITGIEAYNVPIFLKYQGYFKKYNDNLINVHVWTNPNTSAIYISNSLNGLMYKYENSKKTYVYSVSKYFNTKFTGIVYKVIDKYGNELNYDNNIRCARCGKELDGDIIDYLTITHKNAFNNININAIYGGYDNGFNKPLRATNNIIKPYHNYISLVDGTIKKVQLPNNVVIHCDGNATNNVIVEEDCHDITILPYSGENIIKAGSRDIFIGMNSRGNVIGNNCNNITIGNYSDNNEIKGSASELIVGDYCSGNIIASDVTNVTINTNNKLINFN